MGLGSMCVAILLSQWFIFTATFEGCKSLGLIILLKLFGCYSGINVDSKMWLIASGLFAARSDANKMWGGRFTEGAWTVRIFQLLLFSCFGLYYKNPHAHTCRHPHVSQTSKVTLKSSSELQRVRLSDTSASELWWLTDIDSIYHHHSLLPLLLICPQVIPACSVCIHKGRNGGGVSSGNEKA